MVLLEGGLREELGAMGRGWRGGRRVGAEGRGGRPGGPVRTGVLQSLVVGGEYVSRHASHGAIPLSHTGGIKCSQRSKLFLNSRPHSLSRRPSRSAQRRHSRTVRALRCHRIRVRTKILNGAMVSVRQTAILTAGAVSQAWTVACVWRNKRDG